MAAIEFRERLMPGVGVLAAIVGVGGLVFIAVWPVSLPAAVIASAGVAVAGCAALILASPTVEVAAGRLRAGHAEIPLELLGEAQVIPSRDERRDELGPRLDARAYVMLRSWIPTMVRIAVTDPADPTPYWLISTRRPQALVSSLRSS
jgi:hypothetical protein